MSVLRDNLQEAAERLTADKCVASWEGLQALSLALIALRLDDLATLAIEEKRKEEGCA